MPNKRLGVYIDVVYHVAETPTGTRVSTDRSFLLFVAAVGEAFDRLVLFGRTVAGGEEAEYVLPNEVELVKLPHYANLRQLADVTRAAIGTLAGLWRGTERVDVLWVFGPHPFAVAAAVFGLLRRKQVVLGIRQYSVRLYQVRVKGWKKGPAVSAMWLLDLAFRVLGRRAQLIVQGAELAARYGGRDGGNVLALTESVVRARDVAATPPQRDWDGTLELLTVGRLEEEKNPLLLVDTLARLHRAAPGRYRLTWVGRGPLEAAVHQRATALGVDGLITLIGYVPFGPELLGLYRRCNLFVHVSLSEGMPKVLIEALACGTPLVATDVGGIRAALGEQVALLVPPGEEDALVEAIERLAGDEVLRNRLTQQGLELVRSMTLEAEAERVVRFLASRAAPDAR